MKERKSTIAAKITLRVSVMFFLVLLTIGILIDVIVRKFNQQQYNNRVVDSIALMDKGIDNFFDNLSGIINLVADKPLLKKSDGYITSYKYTKVETGKIKMDPEKMGPYEKEVFNELKLFTEQFSSIEEFCLGIEAEGNYVQYPASDRSSNYDCTTRSWFKSAKEKKGEVDISDAYRSSNGIASILVSKYFNDEYGNGRGVLTMTADLSYLKEICDSIRSNPREDGYVLISDKTGTIVLDQSNMENSFHPMTDIIPDFEYGKEKNFVYKIGDLKYDVRVVSSNNKFIPLNYVMMTPYDTVNKVNSVFFKVMICAIILSSVIPSSSRLNAPFLFLKIFPKVKVTLPRDSKSRDMMKLLSFPVTLTKPSTN